MILVITFSAGKVDANDGYLSASEQKTYQFTQAFTACVKRNNDNVNEYENGGAAVSGLMNGDNLAGQGALSSDRRYWVYMDCLNASVAGSAMGSLPIAKTCAPTDALPAGSAGKIFSLGNRKWVCTDGYWQMSNGGIGSTPEEGRNIPCVASTVMYNNCSFSAPSMNSGQALKLTDTPFYNGSFFKGEAMASCVNGNVTVSNKSCEKQICEAEKNVVWYSADSSNAVRCEGLVANDGQVTNKNTVTYFGSLLEAKRLTNALTGRAEFVCDNQKWKLLSGTCAKKTAEQLTCSSRINGVGKLEFTCS